MAALYLTISWAVVNEALVAEASEFSHHPKELGLAYAEVSFSPRGPEDLTLRGWWLPPAGTDRVTESRGTIIWLHGLDGTRAARLPLLRDLVEHGFAVLTFDLRGHGQSDNAPMGAGQHEQADVLGAVDYVLNKRGARPGSVFLMGHSFGAAIVLLAGAAEPAVGGVYADSSFAALDTMIVDEVAARTALPAPAARVLKPGLVLAARVFKGIRLDAIRPLDAVSQYPYVIGLTHCEGDKRIPFRNAVLLRQQAPRGSWFHVYPCEHMGAYEAFPEQYVSVVVGYFSARLEQIAAS